MLEVEFLRVLYTGLGDCLVDEVGDRGGDHHHDSA